MHRFIKLSPAELKALVLAYQAGDEAAAEKICQAFTPLVYRLAHRQTIYNTYGEDAENMLWLWLLDFLYHYADVNFKTLPGLVRKHLICKLMRCTEHQSIGWRLEETVDFTDTSYTEQPTAKDIIQEATLSLAFKQELNLLPSKQYEIIRRFYLEQEPQTQIATSLHCTTRAIRLHKQAALLTLKNKFHRN